MQHKKIENADKLAAAIEQRLNSSEEALLYKKLYTVLLVAKHPENNSSQVARQLGYSPLAVARWVRSVCSDQDFDLEELRVKEKSGRKRRLTSEQLSEIYAVLEEPPKESKKWTGKLLSDYISSEFSVEIQVRQCQKIIKSNQKNESIELCNYISPPSHSLSMAIEERTCSLYVGVLLPQKSKSYFLSGKFSNS